MAERKRLLEGEDRILAPSPAGEHYELTPEMAADKITEKFWKISRNTILSPSISPTPIWSATPATFEATARAIEKVDECVGKITSRVLDLGGVTVISSDHGNAEEKIYKFSGEKQNQTFLSTRSVFPHRPKFLNHRAAKQRRNW